MRMVPINSIKEGYFLAKTIYDNSGRVLLREKTKLTNPVIQKIKDMNIFTLYINDEYSFNEIDDVISPQVRQQAIKTIKRTFSVIERSMLKPVTDFRQKRLNKERYEYFKVMTSISKDIVDEILSKKNIMVNLVDIKSFDNYIYQHSVNVSVLSLILGVQIKLPKDELYDLCIGAMLHDIGKVFIPKSIIFKKDKLTDMEIEQIKEHTTKGYDYLKKNVDMPGTARIIALQHHEKVNGKGYPAGKKSNQINKLAKIVAIADIYDSLTSDTPNRKAMCPNEALEFVMANGNILFDYELVREFSKVIIPYPEGSFVRLSNDDIAVVQEVYPACSLRPKVKIIQGSKNEGQVIDLSETLDIVIKNIEFDINN